MFLHGKGVLRSPASKDHGILGSLLGPPIQGSAPHPQRGRVFDSRFKLMRYHVRQKYELPDP